jgi:hypothetical protein
MEIGDWVYLKNPEKGYKHVEIIGFEGARIWVRTTSGWEFTIHEDEVEG